MPCPPRFDKLGTMRVRSPSGQPWIWVLASIAWLGASCASPSFGADARPSAGLVERTAHKSPATADFSTLGDLEGMPTESESPTPTPAARKMVYNARLSIAVAQVDASIERCSTAVDELGGYISQRDNSTLTCRVPATQFEPFVEALRGYGRVLLQSMNALDVTKQHRDLTIRLENARKSRTRLLALLDKAERVEDMLKIEEQLRRLTAEIEQMTGELKYLDDQISLSTVTVRFEPVAAAANQRRPKRSRFLWINMVGVEHALRSF